jgi:hypothetical protein
VIEESGQVADRQVGGGPAAGQDPGPRWRVRLGRPGWAGFSSPAAAMTAWPAGTRTGRRRGGTARAAGTQQPAVMVTVFGIFVLYALRVLHLGQPSTGCRSPHAPSASCR